MPGMLTFETLMHSNVAWERFDPIFYARAQPLAGVSGDVRTLILHYLESGAAAGRSPNIWFDEAFYRAEYPDVVEMIRDGRYICGFDHYCQTGFADRAPHWLFDPALYRAQNPGLTPEVLHQSGFANRYDHFLKFGQSEFRRGHGFFDAAHYLAALPDDVAAVARSEGPIRHFLETRWQEPALGEPSTSPEFDPGWYRATHPDVAAAIEAGTWHGALHHYLVQGRRQGLAPKPLIKIHVDRPRLQQGGAPEPITGHLDILGWAAANDRIVAVDVQVDGVALGRAHHGIRTEGVAAAFPELTHSLFAGFHFIGGAALSPGRHSVRVIATGASGLVQTEAFDVEFAPLSPTEGPWALRRRMRHSETRFKRHALRSAGVAPVFTVVISPDTADDAARHRTLRSLRRQVYPHWVLHGDVSSAQAEPPASDLWLVWLKAGDELGVDALLELALHRLDDPRCDFIYSDERCEDPATGTVTPWFKPDWSPDLLLGMNYVGRLWAVALPVAARAGLDTAALALADAFDVVLRLTEHATRVGHVARVLCESLALSQSDRAAEQAALAASVRRRGIDAAVVAGHVPGTWHVRRVAPPGIRVSVIIPTAGVAGLIETALRTLRATTDATRIEVIVIDTAPETAPAPWRETVQALADRVIEDRRPFNWSRVNNQGAQRATGDVLLFLNDDIACPEAGWLEPMLAHAMRHEIGAVGARLLYPGGDHVQHAGLLVTREGGRHVFHGTDAAAAGPFGLAMVERNVSAVTGACLMVRTQLFRRLGGFDERLAIVNSDVDLCLRCSEMGLRNLFTPAATLHHRESLSRAGLPEAADLALFKAIWGHRLWQTDPYSNRNISTSYSDHRAEPEYCEVLHAGRPLAPALAVRRVLIVKLDHIGDFILAVPALRRLRRHFDGAHITLLVAPAVVELAAPEHLADEVIAFALFHPKSAEGLRPVSQDEHAALTATLKSQEFDLAIDLRIGDESRPLLLLSDATWCAGFDRDGTFPWLDIVATSEPDTQLRTHRTHHVHELLDFVDKVIACFASDTALATLDTVADDQAPGLREGQIRIAIHPSTGNPNRQWPTTHFCDLIDLLLLNPLSKVFLIGSDDEMILARKIMASVSDPTRLVCMVGSTDLGQLGVFLLGCDLFIGNNSGPQHLAASCGVPTIGIHSGVVDARQWGAIGPAAIAVQRRMVCSPCYIAARAECPRDMECLTGITPEAIFALAQTMLPASWRM